MNTTNNIVITRTPFRISFCGGGSDLESYYENNGGCVISTTINKYIYVICKKNFDEDEIKLKYLDNIENIARYKEINNDILKKIIEKYNIHGVEIISTSDVPKGTGLGSSSTFTIGTLNAINEYKNEKKLTCTQLANYAWQIEKNTGNKSVGKQDQWAAAFGGLKYYQFNKDCSVYVEKIELKPETLEALQNNLYMIYVGGEHKSYEILDEQAKRIKKGTNVENQQKICDLVPVLKKALYDGNIDVLGEVLNQNWNLKKSLASGISNDRLDDIYKKALEKGATGGKLLGAGGSGFFLFYVPRQNHKQFEEFSQNYKVLDFKFEDEGSTIIYKV